MAHLLASFKCSTVIAELLAVSGDFAIDRGAAGGTREVMRYDPTLTSTVRALQTHAAPHPPR